MDLDGEQFEDPDVDAEEQLRRMVRLGLEWWPGDWGKLFLVTSA
jgi:hypothetical protein